MWINVFVFLLLNEFVCSQADTSLFIFAHDSTILYLLVYVGDLILTDNNESIISSFIARLNREFVIKDLGDLNFFLGLEVGYTDDGLFLSQTKYAKDILTRANLLDLKPVSTPLPTHGPFTCNDVLFSDRTLYRSLVGAL